MAGKFVKQTGIVSAALLNDFLQDIVASPYTSPNLYSF